MDQSSKDFLRITIDLENQSFDVDILDFQGNPIGSIRGNELPGDMDSDPYRICFDVEIDTGQIRNWYDLSGSAKYLVFKK
jgi:hypothetical protein